MKNSILAFSIAGLLLLTGNLAGQNVPHTRQDNIADTLHGNIIIDSYCWLEDQGSPETRAWIEEQNRYTHQLLDNLPYIKYLKKRLNELSRIDKMASPSQRGNKYFVWKKRAADEMWILYIREGINGKDQVLIDPHELSPDHTSNISIKDISGDGKLLLYGIRKGGEDETDIRLMDISSRKDLPDRLPRALYYGATLKPDGSGFYYSLHNRKTGGRIWYHKIGSDSSQDIEIFGAGYGPEQGIGASVSDDGRYLLLTVWHGWSKSEIHIQDLSTENPIKAVVTDIDARFIPEFAGDQLIIQTDWQAPNGRILVIDLKDPEPDKWQEIIPEANDAIESFSTVGGKIFVNYLHNVSSLVKIFKLDGTADGEIKLSGICTLRGPWGRWNSNNAFYDISSFTQPRATYSFNIENGKSEFWTRDAVPFNAEAYEVNQIWYDSKDGTSIPMFLVHKKNLELSGKNPTLLYGYGGFNVSIKPQFSTRNALFVENGGVYALANIRGGSEFGEEWHRAGMLENKQNVFDDFIAAAEWLIEEQYTNPSKLAIRGGSNGGLLVGTCLTQRPDLYQAVLCEYPDLDMIGYYRFENNNPPALLEYGDASNPDHFEFLYKYSPYQNTRKGTDYPAVLFTTGDADTRVPPLQARKMTARLQYATISDRPILLLYDTKAGHSGGKPLGKWIEDTSLEMGFLFWQLGMEVSR